MHDNIQNRNRGSGNVPQKQPDHFHAYHDPEGPAKLTTTIVHALADVMGSDVTNVGPCLSDHVDPDALNHIFSRSRGGTTRPAGHVAFTVDGYRVTVYGSGEIVITPPTPGPC